MDAQRALTGTDRSHEPAAIRSERDAFFLRLPRTPRAADRQFRGPQSLEWPEPEKRSPIVVHANDRNRVSIFEVDGMRSAFLPNAKCKSPDSDTWRCPVVNLRRISPGRRNIRAGTQL
jgi:hypothetical protein